MLKKLKPTIAIIDSGIGGIAILNKLIDKFNGGNYIYYADNLNMPYGNMCKSKLSNRINAIINQLQPYNPDLIILACNTASSVFNSEQYKNVLKLQFNTNNTYFATKLTAQTLKHHNIIADNRLAKQIENNIFNKSALEKTIKTAVKKHKLNKQKSLILACTHYELVKDLFLKYCHKTQILCNSDFVLDNITSSDAQGDLSVYFVMSRQNNSYYEKLNRLVKRGITCVEYTAM